MDIKASCFDLIGGLMKSIYGNQTKSINSITLSTWEEIRYGSIDTVDRVYLKVAEIFFSASEKKQFKNQSERQSFFKRWTDYYFQHEPHNFLIAFDHLGTSVLGYLSLSTNIAQAERLLPLSLESFLVFKHHFTQFPAHLHINITPSARGTGVGTHLLKAGKHKACQQSARGIHVVTSPEARNRNFYLRNGFTFEEEQSWNGYPLLFMGTPLFDQIKQTPVML